METYNFALLILISIYKNRADLQKAFPEVFNGKLKRLLDWAISYGITIDSSKPLLCFFEDELRSMLKKNIKISKKLLKNLSMNPQLFGYINLINKAESECGVIKRRKFVCSWYP